MNTFGNRFRLTTFGESHGTAIGGIVDGCPAGLVVDYDLLTTDKARRHTGDCQTPRNEKDEVEFLSGIYGNATLGTPIAFVIKNDDTRSGDYDQLKELFRPGHADYTTQCRYGRRDYRGGGRASGRETAARVVGGALAKMMLREKGVSVVASASCGTAVENDSAGGIIECSVTGLPAGIGDPLFRKLNAMLASAMMSIPSAMGFEVGAGFRAATMRGSVFRDEWNNDFTTKTNHCGGIQGGISNGMPIVFRVAFHPVVTIPHPTGCIDTDGTIRTIIPQGRHDRCHIPRTVVVVESMAAMTIADFMVDHERRHEQGL